MDITNGKGWIAAPDLASAMRLKQYSEHSWYGLDELMHSGCDFPSAAGPATAPSPIGERDRGIDGALG